MAHICYNDICTIISALRSLAMHKENLANILSDEKTREYALHDKDEALRLARLFEGVGNRLLDLDLGKSVLVKASWHKQN